jgi:uncharacterized DUF497 family protein
MASIAFAGFDWDIGNRKKCAGHGVALDEIEAIFAGEPMVAPDVAHSHRESRYLAIGRSASGRAVFVAFTLRQRQGATFVRRISARYTHKKEIDAHEKALSEIGR